MWTRWIAADNDPSVSSSAGSSCSSPGLVIQLAIDAAFAAVGEEQGRGIIALLHVLGFFPRQNTKKKGGKTWKNIQTIPNHQLDKKSWWKLFQLTAPLWYLVQRWHVAPGSLPAPEKEQKNRTKKKKKKLFCMSNNFWPYPVLLTIFGIFFLLRLAHWRPSNQRRFGDLDHLVHVAPFLRKVLSVKSTWAYLMEALQSTVVASCPILDPGFWVIQKCQETQTDSWSLASWKILSPVIIPFEGWKVKVMLTKPPVSKVPKKNTEHLGENHVSPPQRAGRAVEQPQSCPHRSVQTKLHWCCPGPCQHCPWT